MATKISKFYRQAAIEHMSLNITEDEMFVLLPSEYEDDTYYRVDLDEQTISPTKCCCRGFCRSGKCKHFTITAEAFAGYKPAPEPVVEPTPEPVEPKITEIEANNFYIVNSNTQVWRTEEGEWMAVGPTTNAIELVERHLEKSRAVAEAEQIVAQPVKVTQQEEKSSSQEIVLLNDKRREKSVLDAPLTRQGFSLLKVS